MEIRITRTTPIFRSPEETGVFVQWDLPSPPSGDVKKFTLERSGSSEGPFETVVDNITSFHFFDDLRDTPAPSDSEAVRENLNFLSLSRAVYYKLTVTDDTGATASTTSVVGPTLKDRKLALLRRKMQRDLSIAFKFNAIELAVLKRRHWGTRCKDCFDILTKRVTNSKCNTCYGTGFEGGYFDPVRIKGRLGIDNVQTNITPQGKTDVNKKRIIMLAIPLVEADDIIAEIAQNKRYIVQHVHATEMKTNPVHQNLTVSELATDSVEYRIPINSDTAPVIY